jgi:hypothetical protein
MTPRPLAFLAALALLLAAQPGFSQVLKSTNDYGYVPLEGDDSVYYVATAEAVDPATLSQAAPPAYFGSGSTFGGTFGPNAFPYGGPPAGLVKPVLMSAPEYVYESGAAPAGRASPDCPGGKAFVNCFADPCRGVSCGAGATCVSDFCEWWSLESCFASAERVGFGMRCPAGFFTAHCQPAWILRSRPCLPLTTRPNGATYNEPNQQAAAATTSASSPSHPAP